jgi:hypothetical protein
MRKPVLPLQDAGAFRSCGGIIGVGGAAIRWGDYFFGNYITDTVSLQSYYLTSDGHNMSLALGLMPSTIQETISCQNSKLRMR